MDATDAEGYIEVLTSLPSGEEDEALVQQILCEELERQMAIEQGKVPPNIGQSPRCLLHSDGTPSAMMAAVHDMSSANNQKLVSARATATVIEDSHACLHNGSQPGGGKNVQVEIVERESSSEVQHCKEEVAMSNLTIEDEKQHVLSAAVSVLDELQSSVSGDLTDPNLAQNVTVRDIVERAQAVASLSRLTEGLYRKGECVLHIHYHHALMEKLGVEGCSWGMPTCVAIQANNRRWFSSTTTDYDLGEQGGLVAIGTSSGATLVFAEKWALRGVCCSPKHHAASIRGATVALSLSHDGSTIAAGYENGTFVLWSSSSLNPLRTLVEECTTPLIVVRHWPSDAYRVVSLDGVGKIRLFSFTKVMHKVMYRASTITPHTTTERMLHFDILPYPTAEYLTQQTSDRDIGDMSDANVVSGKCLVAAVSVEAVRLYVLVGGLQSTVTAVSHYSRLSQHILLHGCLIQAVVQRLGAPKVMLCVAWGTEVELLQIVYSVNGSVRVDHMERMARTRLIRPLRTMGAVAGCNVLLLDDAGCILLLDASAGVVVEQHSLPTTDFVYFARHVNGATYHGCLSSNGYKAFILGQRKALTCTLLPWYVRLDVLAARRRYEAAFELVKEFASEVALSVVGLSAEPSRRRQELHQYTQRLALTYVSDTLETHTSSESLKDVLCHILVYLSQMDAMNALWGPVWARLHHAQRTGVALLSLESCILRGEVTMLPEPFLLALYGFISNAALLGEAEDRVVSQDEAVTRAEKALMCLEGDIEALLSLAKGENLVRLHVCIMSYRQHRHVQALRRALSAASSQHGDITVAVDYFVSTMEHQALLSGTDLPMADRYVAKHRLWVYLLQKKGAALWELLQLHPDRVMPAIIASLRDDGASCPWDDNMCRRADAVAVILSLLTRDEHNVDPSIALTAEGSRAFRPWELARRRTPPYDLVHCFLDGVAGLIRDGLELVDESQLPHLVSVLGTHYGFMFLSAEGSAARVDVERQLASLVRSQAVAQIPLENLTKLLKDLGMARCTAAVYCQRAQYEDAIACYLNPEYHATDPCLATDVFNLLTDEIQRLQRDSIECEDKISSQVARRMRALRNAVVSRVNDLAAVNVTSLAQFVFDYLPSNPNDVLHVLRLSSGLLFPYVEKLVSSGDAAVAGNMKLQNTYIELLCAHNPLRVYHYLTEQGQHITYDVNSALDAMERHHIVDGALFLLGKLQRSEEAVTLLVRTVVEEMSRIWEEVRLVVQRDCEQGVGPCNFANFSGAVGEPSQEGTVWKAETVLQRVLHIGILHCNTQGSESVGIGEHWLRLWNCFANPLRHLCELQQLQSGQWTVEPLEARQNQSCTIDFSLGLLSNAWNDPVGANREFDSDDGLRSTLSSSLSPCCWRLLSCMVHVYSRHASELLPKLAGVLNLSSVGQQLLLATASNFPKGLLPLLSEISNTLRFEHDTRTRVMACIANDTLQLGQELHRSKLRCVVPCADYCSMCRLPSSASAHGGPSAGVFVFSCGHSYHTSCLTSTGVDTPHCAKCHISDSRTFVKPLTSLTQPSMLSTVDPMWVQHRIQQMCDKVDYSENTYIVLRGFAASFDHGDARSLSAVMPGHLGTRPPDSATELDRCSASMADENDIVEQALVAALTETDIMDIF